MRITIENILEMMIGALLIGAGLLYLTFQYRTVKQLTEQVNAEVMKDNKLYQQYSDINGNLVPDEELYTIIMGYREYPIIIDGEEISVNNTDFEKLISFIKDGYYIKQYERNANGNIAKIIYTYSGT